MNFFDAQDRARRTTRRLVVVYALATLLIVAGVTLIVGFTLFGTSPDGARYSLGELLRAHPGALLTTASLTVAFILGASLYKTGILSTGGGRVARDLGGTLVAADTQDPLRRRLRNVVEEMAIASGVPVPEIYVLEEEAAINAFAAGYGTGDAAVAVTRGTLELLDRDELQGVVAHEFSHILNGDMRLNIRLMGVLFGILVLGLVGRMLVRGGYHTQIVSGRRGRGAPAILAIGLGLALLGSIGVFSARLIKAGVSRQREFLADASAVQFTRQTRGIAGALKKIGGYGPSSYLRAADPEEISHMLFGSGARLSSLFATHPPLAERIRAIDPAFRESDFPRVERPAYVDSGVESVSSQMAAAAPTATAAPGEASDAESIAASVGNPGVEHVAYARSLRESMPQVLYDAAHSAELAYLLAIALVLDRNRDMAKRQLAILTEQLGAGRARLIGDLYEALSKTGLEYRLPLLEVSFPALKLRPEPQLSYLVTLATRLVDVDGHVDLYEYCYLRVLRGNLERAADPARRVRVHRRDRRALRAAALKLLAVVAECGHDDDDARRRAFEAGRACFGKWAVDHRYEPVGRPSAAALDATLDRLGALDGKARRSMLRAVTAAAEHDGRIRLREAELIRAVCAALDLPLPPILAAAMSGGTR